VQQSGAANPLNGLDVGQVSGPALADLDGDGDFDAVVGDITGHLTYFKNTGTATAPAFVQQPPAANPFDGVDVGFAAKPTFVYLDHDGALAAVIGDDAGQLSYFKNTGTATAPTFVQQNNAANPFSGVDVSFNSTPAFADLDGDGDLDLVVGNDAGHLSYFENI